MKPTIPPRGEAPPRHPGDWPWLCLLIVAGTGILIARAGMLSNLFVDEGFTITLVNRSPRKLIELTAFDAHPPGYYLLLKAWLKPWREIMGEPGLLAYRSLGIAAWIAMACVAWFGLRSHLGRIPGTIAATIIMTSVHVVHVSTEARQYSVVLPALFLCWLLMVTAWRRQRERRGSALLWAGYTIAAAFAMWTQYIACFYLLVMGLLWSVICARDVGLRSRFFAQGLVAQAVAVALFLPWLPMIPYALTHLDLFPRTWQTPANVATFLGVFLFWYPAGAQWYLPWPHTNWLASLSLLTLVVPIYVWLRGKARRTYTPPPTNEDWTFQVAAFSLLLAFGYVALMWLTSALGIANMYHAPRYPMHAMPAWIVFMVWAGARIVRGCGWNPMRLWFVMAPWFVMSVAGQASLLFLTEHRGPVWAYAESIEENRALAADDSRPIFVAPSEMTPMIRRLPNHAHARPITELPLYQPAAEARIIHAAPIYWTFSNDDLRVLSLIWGGHLSRGYSRWTPARGGIGFYTITDMTGINHEALAALREEGGTRFNRFVPPQAVAIASPEAQSQFDGWGMIEFADDRSLFRWGESSTNTLRFDREVQPGHYTLMLRGFRHPFPRADLDATINVVSGGSETQVVIPPGGWTLSFPVEIDGAAPPRIRIEMPTWRPRQFIPGALDGRPLTIMFQMAWLEKGEGQ